MNNNIFEKITSINAIKALRPVFLKEKKAEAPAGLFVKCPSCNFGNPDNVLDECFYVCPKCQHHIKISAAKRFSYLFDKGEYRELFKKFTSVNPLKFPLYEKKLEEQQEKSGLSDAAVTAIGTVGGRKIVAVVLDSSFLMGSMGCVVGEKVTASIEYADRHRLPLVIFSASGGARMQEGIYSLMQMAKTSAALKRFSDNGGLYISYLTNPTTGGVTASFASLGDIILAEPDALIGFAGPRVIEQTIHQTLPKEFQKSEFVLDHGFLDNIVPRREMRRTIGRILRFHKQS